MQYHNKKQITLISTRHHGSKVSQAVRTRDRLKQKVDLPMIVKEYSFKKVGVDVGDQQLRNKTSYADNICNKGWSRKWGMHAIQQIRHNAFLCWRDIHGFKTGKEDDCKKWSEQGTGSSKIMWAFQIGLIKGLLAHIRQYKRSVNTRSKQKFPDNDWVEVEHTIINRGPEYKNVRCAVCSYLAQEERKSVASSLTQFPIKKDRPNSFSVSTIRL